MSGRRRQTALSYARAASSSESNSSRKAHLRSRISLASHLFFFLLTPRNLRAAVPSPGAQVLWRGAPAARQQSSGGPGSLSAPSSPAAHVRHPPAGLVHGLDAQGALQLGPGLAGAQAGNVLGVVAPRVEVEDGVVVHGQGHLVVHLGRLHLRGVVPQVGHLRQAPASAARVGSRTSACRSPGRCGGTLRLQGASPCRPLGSWPATPASCAPCPRHCTGLCAP